MTKFQLFCVTLLFGAVGSVVAGTSSEIQPSPAPSPEEQNSRDIFNYETTYTLSSDFRDDDNGRLGHSDSVYDDFSYNHRFLITGNWYFRAGAEYERFDFGGTDNGLPDHLQTAHGQFAIEYVVHDHAGLSIEINPGVYFQNRVSWDAFDIPVKAFVSFPLKKDKIFGVIGAGGSIYQWPPVAPGGGLIWLFTDSLRLEGVFPKPALVYNPTDEWEFRLLADLLFESFRTDDVLTTEKKIRLHNAVLQYSEERGGIQAGYSGFKPFEITVGAGCTFEREFDFYRADRRVYSDPAPYVRLSIGARF
jgi:hypothetical protein